MTPPDRLPHVRRLIAETPWAMLPTHLAALVEIVERRAAAATLTADEIQERITAGPGLKSSYAEGDVAVLPIYGAVVPRANLFTDISGATSLQRFQAALRQAAADPTIAAILLDVNSPGGCVDLVPETAADIRAARGQKPVVAVCNTMAASAAYWLACQADEVVITPSGSAGSIGVFLAHDDVSAAMEMEGVKTTLIAAGRYKVEGNCYEPLTDEARQTLEGLVRDFYGMFTADVAKGRGVTAADVRGGFGEGRLLYGKAAVAAGLADRVDTFDNALGGMLRGKYPRKAGARAEDIAIRPQSADAVPPEAVDAVTTLLSPDPDPGPPPAADTASTADAALLEDLVLHLKRSTQSLKEATDA